MAAADFFNQKIRARDSDGRLANLTYNEPRPDLERQRRDSLRVDRADAGLAGLRLAVEELIDRSCGKLERRRLTQLGPQVPRVLVRIAEEPVPHGCASGRRAAAVMLLGEFRDAEAADLLHRLAQDRSETEPIRVRATLALGRLATPAAVQTLTTLLQKDRSAVVRKASGLALARAGSLGAIGALEEAAKEDAEASVRAQAHWALRILERLVEHRLTILKDPPQRLQAARRPSPAHEPSSWRVNP